MKKFLLFTLPLFVLGFSACEQDKTFDSPDSIGAQQPRELPAETRNSGGEGIDELYGILDMPVKLIIKQNPRGKRYVTYKGVGKECKLENASGEKDQEFFLKKHYLGGNGFSFVPVRSPDLFHLLACGYWESNPDIPILLYMCDYPRINLFNHNQTHKLNSRWNIYRGSSDNTSYVLESYYENLALGVDNSGNIRFSKYVPGKRTQEFEIRPCDDFEVVEMTLSKSGTSSITDIPDFVISESYSNNTSVQQTMTTKITKRAQKTSSFNRKTSLSTQISTTVKVGIKWLAEGEIGFSMGANAEWSYGGQETIADDREYNFPLVIAPRTQINVSIMVRRKKANVDYKAQLRGVNTGILIWEEGTWENIDCTDIVVTLDEYDTTTGRRTGRTRTINGIPTGPMGIIDSSIVVDKKEPFTDIAGTLDGGSILTKP